MVKVELLKNPEKGTLTLAFESSDVEGLEILDVVRVAILGDHEKRAGYINSQRLIVEIKE